MYPYSYESAGNSGKIKRFYDTYTTRFASEPDTVAANVYDAAFLIAGCVERVGDEVEKVKQCLYEMNDFNGASGVFSIDENGDAVKAIFFKRVKDGQFVKYDMNSNASSSTLPK